MTRYHPLLVALHWLLAIMILVALFVGGPGLVAIDNSDPGKLVPLAGHMVWGMVIGVLMIVRLIVRTKSTKPAPADAGNAMLNFGAKAAHWALYILVFAMVGSGLIAAFSADLFAIAFGGSGDPLPADLSAFTARVVHGYVASLIMLVVAAHVLGWAFHQFIRKDGLLKRMWFGKRQA